MGSERTLRMGLAGLGAASTDIIEALRAHPHIELVAACDVREEGRAAFAESEGGVVFEHVTDLARSPLVDAVYVATPNHLHCEHVIAAAEAGKDVIVEKPMALSLDECDRMVDAADRNKTRLLAGHTHSFDAPVVAMADTIRRGDIGELFMINHWYFTDWLHRGRAPEELKAETGGGVVYRQGPHAIDVVRLLADRPVERVRAHTSTHGATGATGSYQAMLEFEGGLHASVTFSGYAFFDTAELTFGIGELGCPRPEATHRDAHALTASLASPEAELAFKNAARYGGAGAASWQSVLRCDEEKRRQPFYGLTVCSGSGGDVRQSPDGLYLYTPQGREEIVVPKEALEREAELTSLYEAWRDGHPLAAHDGAWARDTLAVCLAILESSRANCEVQL